jgi:hypothetical protein
MRLCIIYEMNYMRRVLVSLAIISLLVVGAGNVLAQSGDSRFFAQTGHWVAGDFYQYYKNVLEPDLVFGYPITEAFRDARTGRTIQYFQRARLELFPENTGSERVKLTSLGSMLYKAGNSKLNLNNALACRNYSQTGYSVCFAFLEFFDKYGGLAQFGYPISDFELYNGRIVQYFENARFEWYPELPDSQKVVLANLGRIYLDFIPEDPQLLAPVSGDSVVGSQVLQLQSHVFVSKAVTRQSGVQEIYVVVQDQTLMPVYNANVVVSVTMADGSKNKTSLTTDRNGIAVARLEFSDQSYGSLILVGVETDFAGLHSKSSTSFRVWK